MNIIRQSVVFDASDLEAESTFWAGMYGGSVERDEDWHTVLVGAEPLISVQLAPGHVAPDWPEGAREQQLHLDLIVSDFPAAHARALELGARLLREAPDLGAPHGFQVYADPAGHPFCLCWE